MGLNVMVIQAVLDFDIAQSMRFRHLKFIERSNSAFVYAGSSR